MVNGRDGARVAAVVGCCALAISCVAEPPQDEPGAAIAGRHASVGPDDPGGDGGDTACGLDYAISHRAFYPGAGAGGLVVLVQSTATRNALGPPIASITHSHVSTVVPTAVAGNQTPSLTSYVETQPTQQPIGALVSSSVSWSDAAHFQRDDLCTGAAFTSITVRYVDGTACTVSRATTFPACVAVL